MADNIRLPSGFVLDQQSDGSATIKLPPGFQLDNSPSFAEGAADFAGQIPIGFTDKGLNSVMSAPGAVMAWGAEKLGVSKRRPTSFVLTTPCLSSLLWTRPDNDGRPLWRSCRAGAWNKRHSVRWHHGDGPARRGRSSGSDHDPDTRGSTAGC